MARYDHLQLVRLSERLPRRRHGGGSTPVRNVPVHSARIDSELTQAIQRQQRRRRPEFVDPSLILRVRMAGALLEEDWNQLGLTVLSSDEDRTLILFSSTADLAQFRQRLTSYAQGTPPGQKHPTYNAFIGGIEAIGTVEPRDRIGVRARESGFGDAADFLGDSQYTVDVEIWDIGGHEVRERKLAQISGYVIAQGGEELDRYIGPSITLIRLRCNGAVIQALLGVEEVQEVDFLPVPDTQTGNAVDLTLANLPNLEPLADTAPLIGIIDSGIIDHPLIQDIIAGAIAVPDSLGTADEYGHGTRVAGIAVFGNLRGQLEGGSLKRGARLCAAKVVDDNGAFPDRRLTPSQMREAVTRLNIEFGCRIFVIALGDRRRVYDGGKVGPWAATLDELVAELDVVIIVSAGNRSPRSGTRLEQAITEYPAYLTEQANRLCEPAGALNVITVGSLAHGEGLGQQISGEVGVRSITRLDEPSPFTRIGPGVRGAIKPDLIDTGGTLIFDPMVQRLRGGEDIPEAGILSLHNRPIDQLFSAGSGTSYSAPLVAFKAAQVLGRFPNASANLIRALLAIGATVPPAAATRLQLLGVEAERTICGNGQTNLERAAFSDDARVVLYSEDELEIDHFAIYQLPIPEDFQSERGRRTIRVSLAYDPPVRHTRRDYAGNSIGFRLIRGCQPEFIVDHFRRRTAEEERFPEMPARFNCALEPSPTIREKSSLQLATATFRRDIGRYGDTYYLVVRCAGGWATNVVRQGFAVVAEIAHEAEVRLYERLRQRARVQV